MGGGVSIILTVFQKDVVSSEVRVQEGKLTTPYGLWFMFIELTSHLTCHIFLKHIQFAYSFIFNNLRLTGRDTKIRSHVPFLGGLCVS